MDQLVQGRRWAARSIQFPGTYIKDFRVFPVVSARSIRKPRRSPRQFYSCTLAPARVTGAPASASRGANGFANEKPPRAHSFPPKPKMPKTRHPISEHAYYAAWPNSLPGNNLRSSPRRRAFLFCTRSPSARNPFETHLKPFSPPPRSHPSHCEAFTRHVFMVSTDPRQVARTLPDAKSSTPPMSGRARPTRLHNSEECPRPPGKPVPRPGISRPASSSERPSGKLPITIRRCPYGGEEPARS